MPEGCKIALVLQLGSPVKTVLRFEHPDPHQASCPAFLESVPDEGARADWSRSQGTIELRP